MDKSILDMVHDSAKDLHAAGVMKETTLREFDALCRPLGRPEASRARVVSPRPIIRLMRARVNRGKSNGS